MAVLVNMLPFDRRQAVVLEVDEADLQMELKQYRGGSSNCNSSCCSS
jgi:hypothetical protein